jgi:thymidylate kinase
MNRRREFLQALFQKLDERGVAYCVQRNYEDLYTNNASDIDFVCEAESLGSFNFCLERAATLTGYRLVLRTRYINYSQVFWYPEDSFMRLDLETEIRWRVFPILSAKAINCLRRRKGDFYVPHPRHESVILFAAGIWRGTLSERYRIQLAGLYQELKDLEQLRRTFRAVFGHIGDALAECQSVIASQEPSPGLLKAARRSIVGNALRHRPNRLAVLRYLMLDARRLAQRVRQPPGLSLLYLTSARPPSNIAHLLRSIESLYPAQKTVIRSLEATTHVRLGWRLAWRRLYTLFKGGLFISCHQLRNDLDLAKTLPRHISHTFPFRSFVWLENSRFETTLAHLGTGFMAEVPPTDDSSVRSERLVQFIGAELAQPHLPTGAQTASSAKGAFIVLLGLDGSGKTTVARQLCHLAAQGAGFRAVRYFHWRPDLDISFPIANPAPVPRKPGLKATPLRSFLSVLRLLKNLALTRFAWWLGVRKLLRRQTLIIIDRYYYNYFLDPASVRYYGSARLLEKVRHFYPRPDLVVMLTAPAATLLARKQELSPEEIHRQSAVLEQLSLDAPAKLVLDATRPPEEIAREIWDRLIALNAPLPKPAPLALQP